MSGDLLRAVKELKKHINERKNSMKKRIISLSLTLALLMSMLFVAGTSEISASADDIVVFSQRDPRWTDHEYGYYNAARTQKATIGTSGCGIMAYVNAVYYLTGRFIQPEMLADFSVANGHRVNGSGTAFTLYGGFAASHGAEYGFKYVGMTYSYDTLRDHLLSGGTAVGSAPGHLMAVADYDPSNSNFLILDSASSDQRHTADTGYTWQDTNGIANTPKLGFSAFMMLSPTDDIQSHDECSCTDERAGDYEVTSTRGAMSVKSGHGKGYSEIMTIPNGEIIQINKTNGSWAHVSYNGTEGFCSLLDVTLVRAYIPPEAVRAAAEIGNCYTPTKISWTTPEFTDSCNVRIWKAGESSSKLCAKADGVKGSEYSFALPAGAYAAAVDSVNEFGKTEGYPVEFTVSEGTPEKLEDGFFAYIADEKTGGLLLNNKNSGAYFANGDNADETSKLWRFTLADNGSYIVTSLYDEKALDISGGASENGTPVALWWAHGNENQQWNIIGSSSPYYLQSLQNGLVIENNGAASSEDTGIRIWNKDGKRSQKIDIIRVNEPDITAYNLKAVGSGKDTNITVSWTAENADRTDLVIYDETGENVLHTYTDVKGSSHSVNLPEGSYCAQVTTYNNTFRTTAVSSKLMFRHTFRSAFFVSYDLTGGTGAVGRQTKSSGRELTLSDVVPQRQGFEFVGYTDRMGSPNVKYQPGDTYKDDADITLYAVWQISEKSTSDTPDTPDTPDEPDHKGNENGNKKLLMGDVNGDEIINTNDAIMILRAGTGLTVLDENAAACADVNSDGSVDSSDALDVLWYSIGLLIGGSVGIIV